MSRILALQRDAGNRAVTELLLQRAPTATAGKAGRAKLAVDYRAAVKAGDWKRVALVLNGHNDSDIKTKLAALTHQQRIMLAAGARGAMPGGTPRVEAPLAALDAEADRVGKLTFDFTTAIAAGDWRKATLYLNGFSDADIRSKLSALTREQRIGIAEAARHEVIPLWTMRILVPLSDIDPEADRVGGLIHDYNAAVASKDMATAARLLNAFNNDDIKARVTALSHSDRIALDAVARWSMGWYARILAHIATVDPEAARVGKLTFEYESAVAADEWAKAGHVLNAFNDDDVIAKLSRLKPSDLGKMRLRARLTGAGGGRILRMCDMVKGITVKVDVDEQVGGTVYGVRGAYAWRLTPDALVIDVGMNFKPDKGVTVPVAKWFGFITSTWNHFSAVNQADPRRKKRIDFNPIAGRGHDIQVSAGTGRANAGRYFVADTRENVAVPHEFGHLVGLEDEYERDAGDYQRVAGAPAAGSGDKATAEVIAKGIRSALYKGEDFFEWHSTAVRRRMRAVEKVLADNHIPVDYQRGESPTTREVAVQYKALFGVEMSRDFMKKIDIDKTEFNDWREMVLGSFQYTSTSIMGDMSDHTHPVDARHVRGFVAHVQAGLGGTWVAQKDH